MGSHVDLRHCPNTRNSFISCNFVCKKEVQGRSQCRCYEGPPENFKLSHSSINSRSFSDDKLKADNFTLTYLIKKCFKGDTGYIVMECKMPSKPEESDPENLMKIGCEKIINPANREQEYFFTKKIYRIP